MPTLVVHLRWLKLARNLMARRLLVQGLCQSEGVWVGVHEISGMHVSSCSRGVIVGVYTHACDKTPYWVIEEALAHGGRHSGGYYPLQPGETLSQYLQGHTGPLSFQRLHSKHNNW